jgi:NAD(P)-dependent dehydrogenase (short-subunit alcohol dehydrogenase family)
MSYFDEMFLLQDKVVAITGAAGQLGRKIAEAYLKAGARVIGLDVHPPTKKNRDMDFEKLDISTQKDVAKVFAKIAKKYQRLDILVNNAGVSVFEPFEERTEEKFDWVMDVNLKGTFLCIQSYVHNFKERELKKGAIVNIASFYGVISPDYRIYTDCSRRNSEVYGATKAGIIQMTKYFGVHLAPYHIRVNAVSPGGIYNPENPQGKDFVKKYSARCPMARMAEDREIVPAVLYLSSEASSYVTGHNLIVDGGMSCW